MQNDAQFIKHQTEKCVYCGICSTTCPTYKFSQLETESPRGRVIAMNQVIQNKAPANQRFLEQINLCLQCGSCNLICPAKIPITELISRTKNIFNAKTNNKYLWLAQNSHYFSNLRWLIKPLLPKAMQLSYQSTLPAVSTSKIALFLGCTGSIFDSDTKYAIFNILNQLAIKFITPKNQTCCGSLHYHSGDFVGFDDLLNKNTSTINHYQIKKYLYFASGCKTGLKKIARATNIEFQEIIDFLATQNFSNLKFKPLATIALVHIPCTHQDDLQLKTKLERLLANIPKLKLKFIDSSCCGAAGTHMLTNKNRANAMRQNTLDLIDDQTYKLILTTNIGCRLHLARGLKTAKIMHPVFLLNQQVL